MNPSEGKETFLEGKGHEHKMALQAGRVKMYTNVDGLMGKELELRDYIKENNPGIICLMETKLGREVASKALVFEKYIALYIGRIGREKVAGE